VHVIPPTVDHQATRDARLRLIHFLVAPNPTDPINLKPINNLYKCLGDDKVVTTIPEDPTELDNLIKGYIAWEITRDPKSLDRKVMNMGIIICYEEEDYYIATYASPLLSTEELVKSLEEDSNTRLFFPNEFIAYLEDQNPYRINYALQAKLMADVMQWTYGPDNNKSGNPEKRLVELDEVVINVPFSTHNLQKLLESYTDWQMMIEFETNLSWIHQQGDQGEYTRTTIQCYDPQPTGRVLKDQRNTQDILGLVLPEEFLKYLKTNT